MHQYKFRIFSAITKMLRSWAIKPNFWNNLNKNSFSRTIKTLNTKRIKISFLDQYALNTTWREFLREILYNNIAIITIQHSKLYFFNTFGDFSYTVEWNSLKSVWQISLYTRREFYGNFYHTWCGILVFYGYSGDFCHTCLCFYYACANKRDTEYGNNSHTIDFHTVLYFVLYVIENFTTQCGENHHTDIVNLATLIHTKKLIHHVAIFTILYGNYYPPHGEFNLICIGKFPRRT